MMMGNLKIVNQIIKIRKKWSELGTNSRFIFTYFLISPKNINTNIVGWIGALLQYHSKNVTIRNRATFFYAFIEKDQS